MALVETQSLKILNQINPAGQLAIPYILWYKYKLKKYSDFLQQTVLIFTTYTVSVSRRGLDHTWALELEPKVSLQPLFLGFM